MSEVATAGSPSESALHGLLATKGEIKMIHPALKELIEYPETAGKKAAKEHFGWIKFDKVQEVLFADRVLKMAKNIDRFANS